MADLLTPGQQFVGRYRIERALAQGGMGAVFVAEQLATELTVAIKVLFPQILRSRDAVEKFQFEAKVAARVNSEHIVKVFDAGYDQESGLPFLVMELLDGEELDSLVEKRGALPPAEAAEYVRQVASGLDRAHGYLNKEGNVEPIVHRDLKPENLFLAQRENGDPVVKILDFGIAKVLTDTAKVSQEIKGTPLFMAYEQATGTALSPQTDIWALGLITFYLLTGKIYWKAASNPQADVSALFAEVLTLPLDPPTVRVQQLGGQPTWTGAFDEWFSRCVVRDSARRFPSAGQAARELARALGVSDQLSPQSWSELDATIAGTEHLGATKPSAKDVIGHTVATQPSGTPPRLGTENAASAAPAVGGVGTEHSMAMAHTTAGKTMSGSSSHGLIIAIVAAILALAALAVVLLRGGDPAEETKSADVAETKGDDAPEATSGQAVEKPDAEPSGARVEADPAARDDAREAAHAPTSSAPTLAVPPEVPVPRPAPVSASPAPAPRPKPKVQPSPKTSDVYDER